MSNGRPGEEYVLEDGEGLLDVRGDGFDCGLLLGGEPVALYWADCQGSVGQYLARSRDTTDLSGRLRTLRHVAGGGLDPNAALAPQIWPLLALFTNARYRLNYVPGFPCQLVEYAERFDAADNQDWFYPDAEALIATQPTVSLRRERIDSFWQPIAAGLRPVVFAAGLGGYGSFVLDGHHKLQAYQELRIPPAVLFIIKESPTPIPREEGLRFFGPVQPSRDVYRRLKGQYGPLVTEPDWLGCTDLWKMVAFMRTAASDRKRRLLACASCRLRWQHIRRAGRRAVEVAERFADGGAIASELASAHGAAERAVGPRNRRNPFDLNCLAADACERTVTYVQHNPEVQPAQIQLVHDIFGNPFRTVTVAPAWLSWGGGTVVELARAAYGERRLPAGMLDPARLAVLADALEEAGCTSADLLRHLRTPAVHVRGCWALDLLLDLR